MDPLRPLWKLLARPLAHPAWPRLRALLIALHLAAVVVVACPAPVVVPGKNQWERAGVKGEVRSWQRRLELVGIHLTEKELTETVMAVVQRWSVSRNSAVKPFSEYLKAIGAPQGWYMFTGPDRSPHRYAVDIVSADGQQVHVFTLGEPTARPDLIDPELLGEHRLRRAMFQAAWSERKSLFKDVCRWFGHHIAEKQPDTKEVICSLIESEVDHPWQSNVHAPPQVRKTARFPLQPGAPAPSTAAPAGAEELEASKEARKQARKEAALARAAARATVRAPVRAGGGATPDDDDAGTNAEAGTAAGPGGAP